MGLFDLFRASSPQPHPIFGPLRYSRGLWRGVVALEPERPLVLFLPGPRDAPSADGLRIAELARQWWAQVRQQVEAELFEHYEPYRDAAVPGVPQLSSPSEVWPHVVLSSVQVRPYNAPDELQIALRVAWDDEHTLGALIRDGRLTELNGSILEPR